jgi:hypothetical protein
MDKFGNNIVFEIKTNQIKKIYIHGIVRVVCPWHFIKPAMLEPEFGNGQMMNQGITGYGGGEIKDNFCTDTHENSAQQQERDDIIQEVTIHFFL